jgi:hypothetical protein
MIKVNLACVKSQAENKKESRVFLTRYVAIFLTPCPAWPAFQLFFILALQPKSSIGRLVSLRFLDDTQLDTHTRARTHTHTRTIGRI